MEKQEISLQEALALITQYGLTVTNDSGKVKAKAKKRVSNRRPKGSGSVVNLGKGRNKPYGAFVTTGYDDETGNQIQKSIGYFKTREEALSSLEMYNMQKKGFIKETEGSINPSNIEIPKSKCPTFKEIWDIIFEQDISKKSHHTNINYNVAFNNLKSIHEYRIDRINLHLIQPIFDMYMKEKACKSKLNNMKVICKKIFDYGMKYDYITKDYSKYITFEGTLLRTSERKPYTNDEIKLLMNDKSFCSKLILVSIYTGLRPQELLNIENENVHIEKRYMIGGMKTKSGKDRIIPIHDSIVSYVEEFISNKQKYLVYEKNGKYAYEMYRKSYIKKMEELKLNHIPYDTRHTFATLSKLYGVNEFARKRIMGHSSKDITDDVYTHAPIEFLVKEANKIKL